MSRGPHAGKHGPSVGSATGCERRPHRVQGADQDEFNQPLNIPANGYFLAGPTSLCSARSPFAGGTVSPWRMVISVPRVAGPVDTRLRNLLPGAWVARRRVSPVSCLGPSAPQPCYRQALRDLAPVSGPTILPMIARLQMPIADLLTGGWKSVRRKDSRRTLGRPFPHDLGGLRGAGCRPRSCPHARRTPRGGQGTCCCG